MTCYYTADVLLAVLSFLPYSRGVQALFYFKVQVFSVFIYIVRSVIILSFVNFLIYAVLLFKVYYKIIQSKIAVQKNGYLYKK